MADGSHKLGRYAKSSNVDPNDYSLYGGLAQYPDQKEFLDWLKTAPAIIEV
jgi:hypothetical protein